MDENSVRTLLNRVAEDELPPVRVSIPMAASRGRRKLRYRRIYLQGAAPLAVAAAVAVIVAIASLGVGGGHAIAGKSHSAAPAAGWTMTPAAPVTPVREFNPMRPYATFGWLPDGYSASGHLPYNLNEGTADFPDGMMTDAENLLAFDTATHGAEFLTLNVGAEGNCHLRAAAGHTPTLNCYNGMNFMTLAGPAPEVDGLPAYWDTSGNLAWEYATNSWAQLIVNVPGAPASRQPAADRDILLRIASGVHFGESGRLPVFPFRLTGVAAGWSVIPGGQSAYGTLDGRLVFTGVTLGPAADRDALAVTVQPAGEPDSACPWQPGYSHVTVDGVRAVLNTTPADTGKDYQYLCAGDARGLEVQIGLDLTVEGSPDEPVPGDYASAVAVYEHLRLLGPNPANWTTSPLG